MNDTPHLTSERRPFLTAEWRRLALFTYAVEESRLAPLLPPGIELDLRDGSAFVSLVAFDFLDTRVFGIPWPGYRNFPEINLRFYVREGDRRGVCFVKELVPQRWVAWLARTLYAEPYEARPMKSEHAIEGGELSIAHELSIDGVSSRLRVRAEAEPSTPSESSTAHFFKEHSWGFGRSRRGRLNRYEVNHPVWATHRVLEYELDWDWGAIYGEEWADLGEREPASVVLAEGSKIAVSPLL